LLTSQCFAVPSCAIDSCSMRSMRPVSKARLNSRSRMSRLAARDALPAEFAVAIPRDDAVIAIHGVERNGQRVDDGFGETPLRFGLGRAAFDLFREARGGGARRLVQRRDARRERGLLRRRIDQTALGFAAILRAVEGDDERAERASLKAQRRDVFDAVRLVAQEKLRRVFEPAGGRGVGGEPSLELRLIN
jgi:hypothetical protein